MKRFLLAGAALLFWGATACSSFGEGWNTAATAQESGLKREGPDAPVTLTGEMTQGGLIRGQTTPRARVRLDGRDLLVTRAGAFVIGFDRDHGPDAELEIILPSGEHYIEPLTVAQREYDIQRIDGLPQDKVTPKAPEVLERIAAESKRKKNARPYDTPDPWFTERFDWPVEGGRISGVYGSQRILNGEPRQPHYGIDIASPTGTVVRAPAPGKVRLADPDMYYEGGLIFIDHGHGVITAYLHMDRIDVVKGDVVRKDQPIGTVGATGRVTGPHLDWRLYWRDQRLDPALVVADKNP